jgi:hypothetical protein
MVGLLNHLVTFTHPWKVPGKLCSPNEDLRRIDKRRIRLSKEALFNGS